MQSLLQSGLFLQIVTPGRLTSIVAVVVGVISIVIARQALTRSARNAGSGKPRAIVALVVGLTGIVLSVVHLASTTGGFGTGKGRAGAIVALVVGLIGAAMGGRVLARSRQRT